MGESTSSRVLAKTNVPCGVRGVGWGVLENEQGRTRGGEGGGQNSGILSERFLLMSPYDAK